MLIADKKLTCKLLYTEMEPKHLIAWEKKKKKRAQQQY